MEGSGFVRDHLEANVGFVIRQVIDRMSAKMQMWKL